MPIVKIVPAIDETDGHEGTDRGPACLSAKGDPRKGSESLQDGAAFKAELLL